VGGKAKDKDKEKAWWGGVGAVDPVIWVSVCCGMVCTVNKYDVKIFRVVAGKWLY